MGGKLHRLEIGLQAIKLSPYHAGPTGSSPRTPGHESRSNGMLLSPFSFEARSAIGPRDITSNPSLLRRGYVRAPRGADSVLGNRPELVTGGTLATSSVPSASTASRTSPSE